MTDQGQIAPEHEPMIDAEGAEFVESWKCDKSKLRYSGMRHRGSELPYGVVREVSRQDHVREFTCKIRKGRYVQHGLCRWVMKDEVLVSFFRDDEDLAYLRFNYNFEEVERHDPDDYLVGLFASSFKI